MNTFVRKVVTDLYKTQIKWVAIYLPIVYFTYIVLLIFLKELEIQSMSLLTFTFESATIFLFVCGILLSTIFLPHFIKHGISRSVYFRSAIYASTLITLTILGISAIGTWILEISSINLFKNVVLSTLGANSWLLALSSYFLTILLYFLSGIFIGLSFSRYGVIGGLSSILLAIIIIIGNDLLWSFNTLKPFVGLLNVSLSISHSIVALIGTISIIFIVFVIVYQMIKDIPIRHT